MQFAKRLKPTKSPLYEGAFRFSFVEPFNQQVDQPIAGAISATGVD